MDLEARIEALEQRNAALEAEVKSLRAETAAFSAQADRNFQILAYQVKPESCPDGNQGREYCGKCRDRDAAKKKLADDVEVAKKNTQILFATTNRQDSELGQHAGRLSRHNQIIQDILSQMKMGSVGTT